MYSLSLSLSLSLSIYLSLNLNLSEFHWLFRDSLLKIDVSDYLLIIYSDLESK